MTIKFGFECIYLVLQLICAMSCYRVNYFFYNCNKVNVHMLFLWAHAFFLALSSQEALVSMISYLRALFYRMIALQQNRNTISQLFSCINVEKLKMLKLKNHYGLKYFMECKVSVIPPSSHKPSSHKWWLLMVRTCQSILKWLVYISGPYKWNMHLFQSKIAQISLGKKAFSSCSSFRAKVLTILWALSWSHLLSSFLTPTEWMWICQCS